METNFTCKFLILLHLIQMLKNSGNITLKEHSSLLRCSEKNFIFLSGILHFVVTLFVIQVLGLPSIRISCLY